MHSRTWDTRQQSSGATVGVRGCMVLSAGTDSITRDFKEHQGDSSVPGHLAARFHRNRLAPSAFRGVHTDRAMEANFYCADFSSLWCRFWWRAQAWKGVEDGYHTN